MNVYIDFFSALPQSGMKYHGGGNYTRNIINELANMNCSHIKIIILCPRWFEPSDEPELYKHQNLVWEKIESISDTFPFEEGSVLYYPMLGYLRDLRTIARIRKKVRGGLKYALLYMMYGFYTIRLTIRKNIIAVE